ncbi:acyl carrier protein [Paenibacillus humicus]|uniref:acyl carrier protein n=1 Tax=Paenibacillus humicus TaxID=412861 RepID=UPI003D277F46
MNEVVEKIKKIIIENSESGLSAEDINEETTITDIGLDSIGFIKVIVQIEEEFNISVDDNYLTMNSVPTVRSFIDIVCNNKVDFS